jgi:DNA-binding transcriptional LysR family regulator
LDAAPQLGWDEEEVGALNTYPGAGEPHRDESGRIVRPPLAVAIDLRQLRYFLAVVEELHFGRAAERMHISQPPLSQAIKKLEDRLGVELFHRTSRVVVLTDAGMAFAAEARKVLASFEAAVAEARSAGGVASSLRIGCIPQLDMDRLQRFLGAVRDELPEVTLSVTHLLALDQVARLASGELDIAILCRAQEHPDVEMVPLLDGQPLAAYLPSAHQLAGVDVIGPEQLATETLLTFRRADNPAMYDRLLETASRAGYRFAGVHEASGPDPRDLMLAVAHGAGVALQPWSFMERGHPGSFVVRRPLDPPLVMPELVVAWRANPPRHLRPTVACVRDIACRLSSGDSGASSGARGP